MKLLGGENWNLKIGANVSLHFHYSNFRLLEVSFTLLLFSHYIRFTIWFLFSSENWKIILYEVDFSKLLAILFFARLRKFCTLLIIFTTALPLHINLILFILFLLIVRERYNVLFFPVAIYRIKTDRDGHYICFVINS